MTFRKPSDFHFPPHVLHVSTYSNDRKKLQACAHQPPSSSGETTWLSPPPPAWPRDQPPSWPNCDPSERFSSHLSIWLQTCLSYALINVGTAQHLRVSEKLHHKLLCYLVWFNFILGATELSSTILKMQLCSLLISTLALKYSQWRILTQEDNAHMPFVLLIVPGVSFP